MEAIDKYNGLTLKYLKSILEYNQDTGEWKWLVNLGGRCKDGKHSRIYINGKQYISSRLAYFYMKGEWPKNEIDHKDRFPTNDKWENLRSATKSQNAMNRFHPNISGVTGVYLTRQGWKSCIWINNKQIFLGYFELKEDAIKKRKEAEIRYFGEFVPIQEEIKIQMKDLF